MARLNTEPRTTLADGRELRLRSARPRDAKALVRLLEGVATEEPATLLICPGESELKLWRRRIAVASLDYHSLFLIATVAGVLAGNLSLERDTHPNSSHVAWVGIAVGRQWRGLGVGGALLEQAVDWAASAGLRKLSLGVFPENARALAFYERHRFSSEGTRRAQYLRAGLYHDEVLMARFLTANQ